MSKVQDYIDAGYITPDPNAEGRSNYTITVSIANEIIEGGGFEKCAKYKGCSTEIPAPVALQAWYKKDAIATLAMATISEAQEQAAEIARQQIASLV